VLGAVPWHCVSITHARVYVVAALLFGNSTMTTYKELTVVGRKWSRAISMTGGTAKGLCQRSFESGCLPNGRQTLCRFPLNLTNTICCDIGNCACMIHLLGGESCGR